MNCMTNRTFSAAILVSLSFSGLLFLSAAAAEEKNSLLHSEEPAAVAQEQELAMQQEQAVPSGNSTEQSSAGTERQLLSEPQEEEKKPESGVVATTGVVAAPPSQAAPVAVSQNAPSPVPVSPQPQTATKPAEEVNIWQQLAAKSAERKNVAAVPPAAASQNVPPPAPARTQELPKSSGELNIWQQLAAGPPPAPAPALPQMQAVTAPAAPSVPVKDDIVLTVEEAVRQYRANDFAGAISNLDYAGQLIRQKKSERMKSLLPNPMLGWMAKEAAAKFLGTAVFGGGSTVSRDYYASGGAVISVEIVSDSPVLQSIIMMLNNPLFAGASGGNIQTIKRQRAIIKYNSNDRSGEINIVVDSRFIVTVKGRSVDQAVLLAYAEAVDFDLLAKN
ncbi:hypothetical protein [Candidatus Electronema sp. JM]|uniref:hypothetical protein n=1 Tax=Candidatus Electronema sp. JM TaxID=3401571 RepID=UPI003AA7C90F